MDTPKPTESSSFLLKYTGGRLHGFRKFDMDLYRQMDINNIKKADTMERLKQKAINAKIKDYKHEVEEALPEIYTQAEVYKKMLAYCDLLPTTEMSKFYQPEITRRINVPRLEEKYRDLVKQFLNDTKEEYVRVCHEAGMYCKVKPPEGVYERSEIKPDRNPGKTSRYRIFVWYRRDIKNKLFIMYPLMRAILEECIVSLPESLINYKKFRTPDAIDIDYISEMFKDEIRDCRFFLRLFYKEIGKLVKADSLRGIRDDSKFQYLRACTGLLSIYISRLLVNTLQKMVDATDDDNQIPFLNLTVSLDSESNFHLDPDPQSLIDVYVDVIEKVITLADNLSVLGTYLDSKLETKKIPIFLKRDFVDDCLDKIALNIKNKFSPVLDYIQHLQAEFYEVYGSTRTSSVSQMVTDDLSFDTGCEEMAYYRKYVNKMAMKVSNEYYPIGKLHQAECVASLKDYVQQVMNQIFERLCNIHVYKNERICEEFEMLATRAMEVPTTTEQLMEMGEYMLWANTVLVPRLKEDIQESLKMTTTLIGMADLSFEHIMLNTTTVNWVTKITPILEFNASMFEAKKFEFEERLQRVVDRVNEGIREIKPYLEILDDMDDCENCRQYLNMLAVFLTKIRRLDKAIVWINKEEKCFKFPPSSYAELEAIRQYISPFYHLVKLCHIWKRLKGAWLDGPFEFLDFPYAEAKVDDLFKELTKIQKLYRNKLRQAKAQNNPMRFKGSVDDPEFDNLPAPIKLCQATIQQIKDFRPAMTLMGIMSCDALLERHWNEMAEIAGFSIKPNASTTLRKMLQMNLEPDIDKYEVVSTSAIKERQLLESLEKMQAEWVDLKFITSLYKDTGLAIITQLDDIQAVLDDHIMKTLSMRGSIFVKPYEDRVKSWYEKITRVNSTIEEWGKVQQQWLYLLPIFSSKDIVEQMPEEGILFREVNNIYTRYMKVVERDPRVLDTAGAAGLLENMQYCTQMLEKINDGVVKYLEKKRLFFPRFFFLSNDEMLEILSETKDPLRVQPHLRKCFEAINRLDFDEKLMIHAMISQEMEEIEFVRVISTEEAKGSVEKWLIQVEEQMISSVRDKLSKSWENYKKVPRTTWVQNWPGQVVLAISQVFWTSRVHHDLQSPAKNAVPNFANELKDSLTDIVSLIRSPKLTNLSRITIKALIVIDVHAKDVVQDLANQGVKGDNEFKWLAQLRYYWRDDCFVRLINAEVPYRYEYLGNSDRLVITPLTDRCYRTLICAFHLHLNGAPEGPAGTGKTETTKDLAKALAVQCVVFNCSDGLDYKAMGKFFKGLASSGAWVCFDEFNRIEIEVLSVVAQQILSIVQAVRGHMKKFLFEGTELILNPMCYVCITMNPGYAGRSELPDNLKVLFRTVAMMVPDYAMIGEISLYSYGFVDARKLSVKIVTTYRLCSEQLSSQNHYDYGMRAVKSVLSACGNIKRAFPDENEDILLLRSLTDVNLPKFLNHDVPLFEGIISDLFPGIVLPQPDYVVFLKAAHESCATRNLQPKQCFMTKIIQTYEMMIVRHGFMIVGGPFAGKTSTLKVLADTLTLMNSRGLPQEKVRYQIMNPKAITIGQLYGQFDPISYEWFDGVVATSFRRFVMDTSPDRKWVIFDGPVDAVWIENMNSALDDNKKLCLMSGEVMSMTASMSLIFEVMDLAQASPATVSRCGMIYMEPATLGWRPFVESWIPTCNPQWAEENTEHILALFDWMVPPCLTFIKKNCKMLCNPGEINLVKSTMQIVEMQLNFAISRIKKEDEIKNLPIWIHAAMVYAGNWGLGGILDADSREKYDEFYKNLWKGLDEENPYPEELDKPDLIIPTEGMLINYGYQYRNKGVWYSWPEVASDQRVEEALNIQQVLIPTVETVKYMSIIDMHISSKLPVLLVGPTGTGKSFYLQDLLMNKLDPELYEPAFITFTVKITCNQTQDLVISKLHKRKRGHYGPTRGKLAVIFIDDLNMPEKDTYGAQPPIELLRQFFDHKNWYDLKATTPIYLYDLMFLAAMGLVGGSRQDVYARFLRHFTIFSINDFSEDSMSKIYANILHIGLKNNGFPSEVISSVHQIVHATLDMYESAALNLRPTPAKSHYVFNLRDFSRVIFGCAMLKRESAEEKSAFVKIWVHEVLRVFYDRLITQEDKNWVYEKLRMSVKDHFKDAFDQVFENLGKREDGKVPHEAMQNLMFGSYMDPDASEDDIKYEEVTNLQAFKDLAENCLDEYNATHKSKMNVVLFQYALEHLSKICRVLTMPCGSALLVGISGSGRQSLTRLASAMTGYMLFQPEITNTYGINDWRDDLKKIMKEAGGRGRNCVFLFTEGQIKEELYLQDIDCLLNSGEVPNIYQIDEKQEILEMVRLAAQGGNKKLDISQLAIYNFFTKRTRERLHIILCFSPIGSTFRNRLRLFPSLINCCTIDWFLDWPEDALESVATNWMTDINLPEDVKRAAVIACKHFHVVARRVSDEFTANTGRKSYITSASYLGLIKSFTTLTNSKQEELMLAKYRYLTGLEKLEFASSQIAEMQIELEELKPQLQKMSDKATLVTKQIETETVTVARASERVKEDEKVANVQAAAAQELKSECEAELALAIPILEDAIDALNTLKPADITLVKSMKNPPEPIKLVMAAVCVIKGIKPDRVRDPATGRMLQDYWGPSKRLLGEITFLQQLKDFDKDNIKPDIMAVIRKQYLPHKDFKPQIVAKASSAAEGLCKWIIAMDMYDKVAKEVAPKKARLEIAEREYAATMAILKEKKDLLTSLEEKLAGLNESLKEATAKQQSLQDGVDLCTNKLWRAQTLIGGLGGERLRWIAAAEDLQAQYDSVAGDVLLSCAIIAYLSPFTAPYRNSTIQEWHKHVKSLQIPASENYAFLKILGVEVRIQEWCIYGLPNDAFSIENAIIMDNSMRYSLFIDPQCQAQNWIKKLEKRNHLKVIKFIYANYMKILEQCVENGIPCLLENVEEELEPPLDPLLFKVTYRQAGREYISLGENIIPFHPDFRFYITTKLRNPHYLPEEFNKVTVINFALTLEGLQDQLLGIVVAKERPDLQVKRDNLIKDNAQSKAQLLEVEENILRTLSESQGNILEDEKAIEVLNDSKQLSERIKSRQIISMETEKKIEGFRQAYTPVAEHSAVLYYCISDLPNVDPMYQYSLAWFINLYTNSIESAGRSRELDKRLEFIKDAFTYNLYANICRSLFDKDKMMFSFVLCTKLLIYQKKLQEEEYAFFLTGGMNVENPLPNPASGWLNQQQWDEVCRVADLGAFHGFRESFVSNVNAWKAYYDCDEPEDLPLVEPWQSKLTDFHRLIVMRLMRPDKLIIVISRFIRKHVGLKFIQPPPFDIAESYEESDCICPLIFILSPGTDPMSALIGFADAKACRLNSISLGQGQGPIAQALIEEGQEIGTWVCLQNCHLAVSWMPSLEKIWEHMDKNNTHQNFRLWLTSYPSDKFPVSILQYGVKMTNEPPQGLQQNLLRSYTSDPVKNPTFFEGCGKKSLMFTRLLYGMAFFHAVVQERRTFGALGWNIPYGFNESDFEISANQLQMFINESENPYEAVSYLTGECNYGGRVTDDWDRRLIVTILETFLNPQMVSDNNYSFVPGTGQKYGLPRKFEYDDYVEHIKGIPMEQSPEVFGLHMNAGITRSREASERMLNSMIKVQGEGQAGGMGETDKALLMLCGDILKKLPKLFDLEAAKLKYPVVYNESMNTVLVQEMERFNRLLAEIRGSLSNIQKGVEGIIAMSPALEVLATSLILGRIPEAWNKVSYPSLKNLPNYIADFLERLAFLEEWYQNGKPSNYWLSGFFFTQAFLTGTKQNYARKYTIPIDQLTYDFEIMKTQRTDTSPEDGVYVYGLFTDGARWDRNTHCIAELYPKVLHDTMPLIWVIPLDFKDYNEKGRYKSPLYKTSERRGVLSTTGHSTNYVLPILLETNLPPAHWIKRSVALLCQLN